MKTYSSFKKYVASSPTKQEKKEDKIDALLSKLEAKAKKEKKIQKIRYKNSKNIMYVISIDQRGFYWQKKHSNDRDPGLTTKSAAKKSLSALDSEIFYITK